MMQTFMLQKKPLFFVPVIIYITNKHKQFETNNIIKKEEEDQQE